MPSLFIRRQTFRDLRLTFDDRYKISSDLKLQLEIYKANMHSFEIGNFVATKMNLGGASTNTLGSYIVGWIEVIKVYNDVFQKGGFIYLIFEVFKKLIQIL
jgi:hypothetical protein